MNFAQWLRDAGLARYEAVFSENDIDFGNVRTLSEADLKELGLTLGHRKNFLAAVRTLDAPGVSIPGEAAITPTPALTGERRQLTVLFCDMVSFTQLATRVDPEVLQQIVRTYEDACAACITRYEGYVFQRLGDGIVAFFGYPLAHEGEAERAIYAGLAIIESISTLPVPEAGRLQVRIGIASGLVVVSSLEKGAVGETMNLAARLQGIAPVGALVVSERVRQLAGGRFVYESMGEQTLKGIANAVRAYRVQAVSDAGSRFEAATQAGLTTMMGRELEIGLLLERWQQARDGEGQAVLLSGEPGIGKSRISAALHEQLASQPHFRLRYQCSPYYTGSAFHPIIAQFEQAAGFNRDDGTADRLRKMEAILSLESEESTTVAVLFAALLSLPTKGYPAMTLSPQKQKELTIAALVDQVLRLARQKPVLMIVEDAHWIDPSTLETFGQTVDRMRDASILLLITHRPEFIWPWTTHNHATALSLNRLSRRTGAAIVTQVTGGKSLPKEVLDQILEKSDGIPLFIEELTKIVLESGGLKEREDRFVLDGALPSLGIPSTLRDSLMARIDRLGNAKEVAQLGACIGREFSDELVRAISPMPATTLNDALEQLTLSGLVFRRGGGGDAFYSFKHALIQDTAYESLLNSRRQQVHADIARELEARFPELARTQPELMALHLTRAHLHDAAVPKWLMSAQRCAAANRFREGVAHVESGLAIVQHVAADQRSNLEAALLVTGGFCHMAIGGYASPPAATLFARAETLLDSITDTYILDTAMWAVGALAWVRADFPKAYAVYERLSNLAEQSGDVDRRMLAYFCFGTLLNQVAQYERGRRMLEFVVEHYDPQRHARFMYTMGHDVKAVVCAWLAVICASLGQLDQARRYARLGVEQANAVSHPFSLTEALSNGALAFAEAGDCDEAIAMCRQCLEVCESQSVPFLGSLALTAEGVARCRKGEYEKALASLKEGMARAGAAGAQAAWGYWYGWRAIALAHMGDIEQARKESDLGRAHTEKSGETGEAPFGSYARGIVESLAPTQADNVAEGWFQRALNEAKTQTNRLIELRAAIAITRIWRERGKAQQSHTLLAQIHAQFTEGFDCLDWREANELLRELSHSIRN